jgi:mannosyltransferase OCH1-like enzyme
VRSKTLSKEGGVYLGDPIELLRPLDGCFQVDYIGNFAQSIATMIPTPQQPFFAKLIQRYPNLPAYLHHHQTLDALGLYQKIIVSTD